MKLAKYLHDKGITQETFAESLGAGQQSVSKWVRGDAVPRAETIGAIDRLTKGAVRLADWFDGKPAGPLPRRGRRPGAEARA